jgi:hypothetical protein
MKSASKHSLSRLTCVMTATVLTSCAFNPTTNVTSDRSEVVANARLSERMRRAPERTRVGRRVEQTRLQPRVMPLAERYHPLFASKAMGSIAVGTVTQGYLARGVEVDFEGPHHAILKKIRKRHTRFTSDEMLDLLMCVAERVVQKHSDQKLHLGNLSRRGGGDIPWSVSHNNGRDADIAFLGRNVDGSAAVPHHLYHFNRRLEATDSPAPMVFDVAANWTMIKALLQCPKRVPLKKLFIAKWLRYPILRYARAAKEPNELRHAAAALLRQPRRTSPHSDHLHLRIGCPADDVAEGCLDKGRAPQVEIGRHRSVRVRLPALRKGLSSTAAGTRRAAAYLLGLYHDTASADAFGRLLQDNDPTVREMAVKSLVRMGTEHRRVANKQRAASNRHRNLRKKRGGARQQNSGFDMRRHIGRLDAAFGRETSAYVAMTIADALAQFGAVEQLAHRLADMRTLAADNGMAAVPVRSLALQQLAESGSLAAAHAIVPLMTDSDASVRENAQRAIERLTNRTTTDLALSQHGLTPNGETTVSVPIHPVELVALWQRFLAAIPAARSQQEVVLEGFRSRGLPIERVNKDDLDGFAVALSWEAPYRDNAARLIAQAIDYHPELGRGAWAHPHAFWMKFLGRRRMIDTSAVARGILAAESQIASQMSLHTPPHHAH